MFLDWWLGGGKEFSEPVGISHKAAVSLLTAFLPLTHIPCHSTYKTSSCLYPYQLDPEEGGNIFLQNFNVSF